MNNPSQQNSQDMSLPEVQSTIVHPSKTRKLYLSQAIGNCKITRNAEDGCNKFTLTVGSKEHKIVLDGYNINNNKKLAAYYTNNNQQPMLRFYNQDNYISILRVDDTQIFLTRFYPKASGYEDLQFKTDNHGPYLEYKTLPVKKTLLKYNVQNNTKNNAANNAQAFASQEAIKFLKSKIPHIYKDNIDKITSDIKKYSDKI